MKITSKLPGTGTTIFTVMSGLATEYNAVNLGQGFPDFEMNEALTELVNKAMKNGYNQYAPMQGWMPLRESISEKIKFLYGTISIRQTKSQSLREEHMHCIVRLLRFLIPAMK